MERQLNSSSFPLQVKMENAQGSESILSYLYLQIYTLSDIQRPAIVKLYDIKNDGSIDKEGRYVYPRTPGCAAKTVKLDGGLSSVDQEFIMKDTASRMLCH